MGRANWETMVGRRKGGGPSDLQKQGPFEAISLFLHPSRREGRFPAALFASIFFLFYFHRKVFSSCSPPPVIVEERIARPCTMDGCEIQPTVQAKRESCLGKRRQSYRLSVYQKMRRMFLYIFFAVARQPCHHREVSGTISTPLFHSFLYSSKFLAPEPFPLFFPSPPKNQSDSDQTKRGNKKKEEMLIWKLDFGTKLSRLLLLGTRSAHNLKEVPLWASHTHTHIALPHTAHTHILAKQQMQTQARTHGRAAQGRIRTTRNEYPSSSSPPAEPRTVNWGMRNSPTLHMYLMPLSKAMPEFAEFASAPLLQNLIFSFWTQRAVKGEVKVGGSVLSPSTCDFCIR